MRRAPELLRDLGWKLAAVVLAYSFWLAVVEEPLAIRQIDVPVDIVNLGPTLAIVRDRPSSIVVRVEAPELVAKELQPTDVLVRLDLGGLGQGKHRLRLAPDGPAIMPRRFGVKVTEVFPASLELTLEPKVAREVEVAPTVLGRPAEGFEVIEIKLDPPRVRVEGPQSEVDDTDIARTREIPVDGKRASFAQQVAVDVASPDVRIVGEPRVRVSVTIAEGQGEKVFSDLPVALLNSPWELRAAASVARIAVRGPSSVLARLDREDVVAWVDLRGLAPRAAEYRAPIQVDFRADELRERLRVRSVAPGALEVRILNQRTPRSPARPAPPRSQQSREQGG